MQKNFKFQYPDLNISPSIYPVIQLKISSFKNLKCSLFQATPAIRKHFVNFVHEAVFIVLKF